MAARGRDAAARPADAPPTVKPSAQWPPLFDDMAKVMARRLGSPPDAALMARLLAWYVAESPADLALEPEVDVPSPLRFEARAIGEARPEDPRIASVPVWTTCPR